MLLICHYVWRQVLCCVVLCCVGGPQHDTHTHTHTPHTHTTQTHTVLAFNISIFHGKANVRPTKKISDIKMTKQ